MTQSFAESGRYAVEVSPSLRVLALNTLYYATSWCPDNSTTKKCKNVKFPDDPMQQFEWLELQLSETSQRKQRAIVVGHIAPSLSRGLSYLYKTKYQIRMLDLFERYNSVLMGIFFGHVHRDQYSIFCSGIPNVGCKEVLLSCKITGTTRLQLFAAHQLLRCSTLIRLLQIR